MCRFEYMFVKMHLMMGAGHFPGQKAHASSSWRGTPAGETINSFRSTGMRLPAGACWGGCACPQRAPASGFMPWSCARRHTHRRSSADCSVAGRPRESSKLPLVTASTWCRSDSGLSSSRVTTVEGFKTDAGETAFFSLGWPKPNQERGVLVATITSISRTASVDGSTRMATGWIVPRPYQRLGCAGPIGRPSLVTKDLSTVVFHPVCTT